MKKIADKNTEIPQAGRRVPKWVVILAVCVLTLSLIGVGRHFYLSWREQKLIDRARAFLSAGDFNSMRIAVDQVLLLDPKNVEATRISAQAYTRMGNAKALTWLRRTVELAPKNLDDQIALAEGALLFGKIQEAADVVRKMETEAGGRADFRDLAGRIALGQGQISTAEKHFAEAVKLAPNNSAYRMRLAIVRVKSPEPAVQKEARKEIETLLPETGLRVEALRALVVDALRNIQPERALKLASELDGDPGHLFSDRLIYLGVLHAVNSPEFQTVLKKTEDEAALAPAEILPLLSWMNSNQHSLLAKAWALRLPSDLVSAVPIRMEIARAFAAFGDWKRLKFFLADENWGDLEYMKKAFLSRAYREMDKSDMASKTAWKEAMNLAGTNGDALMSLARAAMQWGWEPEAVQALWLAVPKSNRSAEALKSLCEYYYLRRDTAGLYRAYLLLVERNPGDTAARNNLAMFCLLLDKEMDRAQNIARDLHEKEPADPTFASTYAFALFRAGKASEAVDVLKKLKPEELRNPSVAAYYSAFLAAIGRMEESQEYRNLARNTAFLPEEERILNLAPPPPPAPAPRVVPVPAVPAATVPAEPAPTPMETPVPAIPAATAPDAPAPTPMETPVPAVPATTAPDAAVPTP